MNNTSKIKLDQPTLVHSLHFIVWSREREFSSTFFMPGEMAVLAVLTSIIQNIHDDIK